MTVPAQSLTVALVQTQAGGDREANLQAIERMLDGVGPVDLIALPEVFARRGSEADYRYGAEGVPGPLTDWLARLAGSHRCWVLGGSVLERQGERVFNTSVLIDRRGRLAGTYRKMHLFEATLDTGQVIRERDAYEAGHEPVMVDIEGWHAGVSICYDVRFPELYRHYSSRGAHLLLIPSNFTQRTGRDHWEVLVRARAIENQCFVVAPDQCGPNPVTGVVSHGHSLAAGPWGEVLAEAGTDPGVVIAHLDPCLLKQTRERVPALRHRRM